MHFGGERTRLLAVFQNTVISRVFDGCAHVSRAIGADGFGFAPDGTTYHKIPHIGIVQIDDDVEIGANTTIDRATIAATQIDRVT